MKGVINILIVIIYFMAIGIIMGKVAGYVGRFFNFTKIFTDIFRFFQKTFSKDRSYN